jgi:hypothetical protein
MFVAVIFTDAATCARWSKIRCYPGSIVGLIVVLAQRVGHDGGLRPASASKLKPAPRRVALAPAGWAVSQLQRDDSLKAAMFTILVFSA